MTNSPVTPEAAGSVEASTLAVRPGEDPWTEEELAEVTSELREHRDELRARLAAQEVELVGLMRDSGDGAGPDQADLGAATFERDQEIAMVTTEREALAQIEHTLDRVVDGSFGVCESCGEAIGKMRVMAFPRATLCLSCKQREERR